MLPRPVILRFEVEAVPLTVRAALVVAPVLIPTLPFASIMKAVEVADAVEVEMANRFWLSRVAVEVAAMERRAKGEVVPRPRLLPAVRTSLVELATMIFIKLAVWPDRASMAKAVRLVEGEKTERWLPY